MKKYLETIKNSKLFSGISDDEIYLMLNCLNAERKSYKKDEYIFRSGQKVNTAAMILSGKIIIQKEDYWGNLSILNMLFAGEVFAESYAVPESDEIMNNVIAMEDSEVLFMEIGKLLTICTSGCSFHNRAVQNMFSIISAKNRSLTMKVEHMAQRTTRAKLLSYLSERSLKEGSNDFCIPLNRQQLADYLSVERSAMSNELSKMRNEGLIDFRKNHFVLK